MISFKHTLLAVALGLGITAQAHATNISLIADGQWNEFNVNDNSDTGTGALSNGVEWVDLTYTNSPDFGTPLSFQFTIQNGFVGYLTVVDSGIAGEIFDVKNNGVSIGQTSSVGVGSDYVQNFDANLADNTFSSGVFTLSAGTYNITGSLFNPAASYNLTNGALKLEVAAVPEESTFAMLLAGLGLMAVARRRA